jgi:hypothetical protein
MIVDMNGWTNYIIWHEYISFKKLQCVLSNCYLVNTTLLYSFAHLTLTSATLGGVFPLPLCSFPWWLICIDCINRQPCHLASGWVGSMERTRNDWREGDLGRLDISLPGSLTAGSLWSDWLPPPNKKNIACVSQPFPKSSVTRFW